MKNKNSFSRQEGEERKRSIVCAFLLLITAIVWGFAFVSQSVGAQYIGALTFLSARCWIAVAVLLPVTVILLRSDRKKAAKGAPSGDTTDRANGEKKTDLKLLLAGGIICGTALFSASFAQQAGIAYTTTAKSGFITTLYVILVPVLSVFLGKRPDLKVWCCVILGVIGLYFLCMNGSEGGVNKGDLITMLCALLFSIQILAVNHFVKSINGIVLSFLQTLTEAILATVLMLIFEQPAATQLRAAAPAILYAGVMSSGVGYTLQAVAQEGLDPTVAALIMCLESVFGAVGGWLILGQKLTGRELFGCALMFLAVVLAQLPTEWLLKNRRKKV